MKQRYAPELRLILLIGYSGAVFHWNGLLSWAINRSEPLSEKINKQSIGNRLLNRLNNNAMWFVKLLLVGGMLTVTKSNFREKCVFVIGELIQNKITEIASA